MPQNNLSVGSNAVETFSLLFLHHNTPHSKFPLTVLGETAILRFLKVAFLSGRAQSRPTPPYKFPSANHNTLL